MTDENKKNRLSHVDASGRARMVDVGGKKLVDRYALASGQVIVSPACAAQIAANAIKKGDVLSTAQLAGVMAAKRTWELIPMCHPLRLDHIDVECKLVDTAIQIIAQVSSYERTGVEMEALTAVSVAALTVFDMCKAVDPAMTIGPLRVETKMKNGNVTFER
ncbi:MAG: molybdenum cofactor biosynthesis protein MoaC [Phycisphaerae bacterium SM23_30]|nr:MAG: molybdenum cofactor biosynthesis protein MoaC [Phycisphaerae bacterium SM23_30]